MKMFELPKKTVNVYAGGAALPGAAELTGEHGGVPVVDAQGRITGVLIDDRAIYRAWRAQQGVLAGGVIRVLDLIANDGSAFFLGEDGIVQQRIPEDLGDDHAVSVGAFVQHARRAEGYALRERSESFEEHYRQATHLWNTLSVREREHLVLSARFELGKIESREVWLRAVAQLRRVDREFARRVAKGLWHSHGDYVNVIDLVLPR